MSVMSWCASLNAQINLVVNGSFEDYSACPADQYNLSYCIGAFNPCLPSTSDYFNTCAPLSASIAVPKNNMGFQHPYDGEGYTGLHLMVMQQYREYLQVKLKEPLQADTTYHISFYVSLANKSNFTSNDLGAVFTSDSICYPDYLWEFMEAEWMPDNTPLITDTLGWLKLEGDYTAQGGEEWIILGSFLDQPFMQPLSLVLEGYAFIYIDGLSIEEKYPDAELIVPNIFTPNGDGKNDYFRLTDEGVTGKSVQVVNRWGQTVYTGEDQFSWDGTINGEPCQEGVYYYIIRCSDGKTGSPLSRTGFVHLMR